MIINFQENDKKRLDVFLVEYFQNEYSREKLDDCIEEKLVFVNKKNQKVSYRLKINDVIEFDEEKINLFLNPELNLIPYECTLDIKYEDDDVIVINKPKNMLSHPTKYEKEKTLANALLFHCKNNLANINTDRPGIVHRLDKNTAGLIVACKTDYAYEKLKQQISSKIAKRKYKAIALGNFENKEGIINKPLLHYLKENVKMTVSDAGMEAITEYRVLEEYIGATLVELELKTGRTHQIRAHLASLKHPVFGDSLYGAKSFMRNEFYNLKTTEQLLQSYYLSFIHPRTEKRLEFQLKEKEFSEDFIKVLNFLRRINNAN